MFNAQMSVATTESPPAEEPAPQQGHHELIVRVEKLGKSFRRFERQPFLLRNLLLGLIGKGQPPKEFWPLRNVSFDVRQGECIGVIGHNGSGKSTLLRLIAGACFPTEGRISVRGRIAPLLSLGTGFLPDMTGRECVEINATALGLTRQEIKERLEDILHFAELEGFLDTPVRYYSSGMMARLGFSVAIHTNPDLLIVDEALAVGDYSFQQKCIARVEALREAGTTILVVSHATELLRSMCHRVLWLRDGQLVADGEPGPILNDYLAQGVAPA
jgi:ABC-type polysaccharide/polyol phosphate transport system ATPase subunit